MKFLTGMIMDGGVAHPLTSQLGISTPGRPTLLIPSATDMNLVQNQGLLDLYFEMGFQTYANYKHNVAPGKVWLFYPVPDDTVLHNPAPNTWALTDHPMLTGAVHPVTACLFNTTMTDATADAARIATPDATKSMYLLMYPFGTAATDPGVATTAWNTAQYEDQYLLGRLPANATHGEVLQLLYEMLSAHPLVYGDAGLVSLTAGGGWSFQQVLAYLHTNLRNPGSPISWQLLTGAANLAPETLLNRTFQTMNGIDFPTLKAALVSNSGGINIEYHNLGLARPDVLGLAGLTNVAEAAVGTASGTSHLMAGALIGALAARLIQK